jgi:hypothetical protein
MRLPISEFEGFDRDRHNFCVAEFMVSLKYTNFMVRDGRRAWSDVDNGIGKLPIGDIKSEPPDSQSWPMSGNKFFASQVQGVLRNAALVSRGIPQSVRAVYEAIIEIDKPPVKNDNENTEYYRRVPPRDFFGVIVVASLLGVVGAAWIDLSRNAKRYSDVDHRCSYDKSQNEIVPARDEPPKRNEVTC